MNFYSSHRHLSCTVLLPQLLLLLLLHWSVVVVLVVEVDAFYTHDWKYWEKKQETKEEENYPILKGEYFIGPSLPTVRKVTEDHGGGEAAAVVYVELGNEKQSIFYYYDKETKEWFWAMSISDDDRRLPFFKMFTTAPVSIFQTMKKKKKKKKKEADRRFLTLQWFSVIESMVAPEEETNRTIPWQLQQLSCCPEDCHIIQYLYKHQPDPFKEFQLVVDDQYLLPPHNHH